ncbi:MAG: hypothetical protein AB7O82_22605, partial [Reyranella sp.]
MWVTGANAYDPNVNALLGFEAPSRLVGFLTVGTPARARRRPSRGRNSPLMPSIGNRRRSSQRRMRRSLQLASVRYRSIGHAHEA